MGSPIPDTLILHICSRTDWEQAGQQGEYRAASLDGEGFIHCSSAGQVLDVANAFYCDVPDLVLLWIEPEKLSAELKWEPPAHPEPGAAPQEASAQLFPHVYGPINLDAVRRVRPFTPDADGVYRRLPAAGGH